MPSPFPGMDPYLEPRWLDVHARLVTYASDALNGVLPVDLIASTEERVAVETDEDVQTRYHTDVGVVERRGSVALMDPPTRALAAAPVRLVLDGDPALERYVTVVEMGHWTTDFRH